GLDRLGHLALQGWLDGTVGSCYEVPARLGLPGRSRGVSAQRGAGGRPLGGKQDALFCWREILREIILDAGFREFEKTLLVRSDLRIQARGLDARAERTRRLTDVRSEGGNVSEPHHLGVIAGFRNDHATIGMADENGRATLERDRALDGCYVGIERIQGQLDRP